MDDLIEDKSHITLERGAIKTSIVGRSVIIVVEFIIIMVTSSQAILMDMAYDFIELATVILAFYALPKWLGPRMDKRPYGLAQSEVWLVIFRTAMQLTLAIVLIFANINIIRHGGNRIQFDEAAGLELFTAVLALIVLLHIKNKNKILNSPSLAADIISWRIDIVASMSLGTAFLLTAILDDNIAGWLIPHIDPILAIALSAYGLKGPIRTLIWDFEDLTLIEPDEEAVKKIEYKSNEVLNNYNLGKAKFYILKTGRKTWVSIYISNDEPTIDKVVYSKVQNEIQNVLSGDFSDLFVEVLPEIS